VLKLMREEGRVCLIRRKKYVSYEGAAGLAAANVLERDFRSSGPNQKWATDVTDFKVLAQKQYLSPVIDLFKVKSSPTSLLHHRFLAWSQTCWTKHF